METKRTIGWTKCQHCSGFGPDCSCSTPEGIVKKLWYQGLRFLIGDNNTYLQVTNGEWKGRKWRLSPHMTTSEIVQTAFMACLAWEEHEARERFKYKGQAIFGPHFNVEALVRLAEQGNLSLRTKESV